MTNLTAEATATFIDWSESVDVFLADLARVTTRVDAPAAAAIEAGSIVADRYRLRQLLGRGASGVVWVADDSVSGLEVAVKLLRPASSSAEVRIRAEVGALRSLRTPGAVRLLDEGLDAGLVFIVMPLVPGAPFPGRPRPTTWEELEPLATRLLETLGEVHSLGIVHRDLKPANVLVNAGGQPIVLDFGLSLPAFLSRPGASQPVLGTPAYLAPEQVDRGEVDAAADLYAVGVMLFESLTGRLPHQATGVRALLAAKLHPPPPLRHLVPGLPPHVAHTIDWLLATSAADRPRSAAETIARLQNRSGAPRSDHWPDPIASGSDVLVAKDALASLFADSGPFTSVSEDAVERLFHDSSGRASEIRDQLEKWLADRVCRWTAGPGSKLAVDRFALDGLEARRRLGEARSGGGTLAEVGTRTARELAVDGRLGLAAAVVQQTLWELGPDGGEASTELLSLAVEIALADGEPKAIDRVLYDLCRAGPGSPHVRHLEGLVRAALAVGPWTERALDLASDLAPFERLELELLRQSVRVYAARRASMERETQVLEELASWSATHPDPIARGTYAGWLGRLRYRQGRYLDAAELHRESAGAPLWRAARATAVMSAASALMEAFQLDAAAELAQIALGLFEACRHSTGRAQATWFARTIAYRRGDDLAPDDAWIDWIAALDMREFEGLAILTEAAIAWRSGEVDRAKRLGSRGEVAWTTMGETAGAGLLVAAIAIACSPPRSVPETRVEGLARAASACPTPGVGIQVLALIGPHRATRDSAAEEALSAQVPHEQWPHRIDVLSVAEARAMLGHD